MDQRQRAALLRTYRKLWSFGGATRPASLPQANYFCGFRRINLLSTFATDLSRLTIAVELQLVS